MRKTVLIAVAALLGIHATGSGQAAPKGGTIAGVVLDDSGHPLDGADVVAFPDNARARTDSTGRFTLPGLDGGFYRVRVRRLGYSSLEISTDLTKNGHVELRYELKLRPAILDSVVVLAHGNCPALSYTGFNCRKRGGKGVYLTDDDLADKGAIELGEVFSGVAGFRIDTLPGLFGQRPIPRALHGARCLNAIVNGKPLAPTNPLPRYATELLAVEIYAIPNDVPPEYARYVWQGNLRQSSMPIAQQSLNDRCSLVVYWTSFS
jgi:hypothetical protein